MDLSFNLRKRAIRAALAASVAGVMAATMTGTGTATAPPATGWTHDLLMQREAYHSLLGGSASVSAATPAAAPVSAAISVGVAKTATIGLPAVVAPGYRTFQFHQVGRHPRGANIIQFKPGYTLAQAKIDDKTSNGNDQKAIKAFLRLVKGLKIYGGPTPVGRGPATTGSVIYNLTPGAYYLINADAENGGADIFTPFTVRGATVGAKPRTAGSLLAKEYTFVIPAALRKAGKHVFEVGDAGAQAHIMELAAVPAGTTEDGLLTILTSDAPPPAGLVDFGDIMGLTTSGGRTYKSLNLRPGTYALVCFLPEQVKRDHTIAHFQEGMIRIFTVS